MKAPIRKYFVMGPASFSHNGEFYWQELLNVKPLTATQHYVNRVFAALTEAEIWVARDGGMIKHVSKKNLEGKWDFVYSSKTEDDPHNSLNHHLMGMRVSGDDF